MAKTYTVYLDGEMAFVYTGTWSGLLDWLRADVPYKEMTIKEGYYK